MFRQLVTYGCSYNSGFLSFFQCFKSHWCNCASWVLTVIGMRLSPNTVLAHRCCPAGSSDTPESHCHYYWRSRNRPRLCCSRQTVCNVRPLRTRSLLFGRDNYSFRRTSPPDSGPSGLCVVRMFRWNRVLRNDRALLDSHPHGQGRGRGKTGLSLPDGRPKSERRWRASHSTRAAQLQRQRARG
jgi:hypothetical protein